MKIFYDADKHSAFRKKVYMCFSELAFTRRHNNYIHIFVIALETLQLCWYSIAPKFVHNTSAKQWLEDTLYSIQIDNALNTNNKKVFLSLLYLAFGWKMLCLLVALLGGSGLLKPNALKSRGERIAFSFIFFGVTMICFVLALPIFHIYLSVLVCNDENKVRGDLVCYEGIYFLHVFVALLGIAIQLFIAILSILYSCNLNPFSPLPYATTENRLLLYRLYAKLLLPLFLVLTAKYESLSFIVYIYAILWFGNLVYRYRQNPDFHKSNFFYRVGTDVLILWVTVYELVRLGIDKESKDASISVIFFVCCPVIIYGVSQIIKERHNQYKILHIKDFAKDTDVEIYLTLIIDLIKKRKNPKQWMELEGLVNHHVRQCSIVSCQCLQLSKNEDLSAEEDEKVWYRWVQNLIDQALEKFPKSGKLHLLSAFVHYVKLKNTFKALHELEITETVNRRAEEDFMAFYYKMVMEHEIIENDQREKEAKGTEFSRIMAFHEGFTELEGLLSEAISYYIDFWNELLEAAPHVTRLYTFGAHVVDSTDIIMEKYTNLIAINPSHIRLHQAYGDFTKIVLPDSNESTKAFEKLDNETATLITKHQIDTNAMRYIEEDQDHFVVISGSHKNMGTMTDIGARVTEKLGYTRGELLNRNVSVLMPRVFAEVHDQLLGAYLLNTSEKSHDPHRNKIVFPADKSGYLVPCNVVVYILPTLKEGIRLAGFLRELDDLRDNFNEGEITKRSACYLVINTDTQLIQGVSRSCWDAFGISCSFVEGNEGAGDVGVTDLFGEFGSLDMVKLKSEEGVETFLDTTKLSQYHFISEQALRDDQDGEDSEQESSSPRERFVRFRQARVVLRMILEADYFGNRVQVLKFTEIIQEGETHRVKSPKILKRHEMFAQNANQLEETSPRTEKNHRSSDSEDYDGLGESSVGTVNEDLKILKEIRILFSNKKSSRAMRVLMVVFGMFSLWLIGLAAFQLSMMDKQINEFSNLLNYTILGYNRFRSLADVLTIVRQYQYLTFTSKVNSASYVSYYTDIATTKIKTTSNTLSNYQFSLIEACLTLEGSSFISADTETFTFELFLDSATILQNKIYIDGYFQFMTAVDQVQNASLASLVSPQSSTDPTLKSFNYAMRNGFGPLREGAEMMIANLDNYHTERRGHYEKAFQIILVISEITIAIAAVVSLPFIFAALHTKEKIISLFGYIPVSQIESMIENGERYKEEYFKTFIDPSLIYDEEEQGDSIENSRNNIKTVSASQGHDIRSPDESQVRSNIDESEDPGTINIDEGLQSPRTQLSPLTLGTQMPTVGGYRQTTIDVASPRDPFFMSSVRLLSTQNHHQQFNEKNLISGQRFNQNEESSSKNSQREEVRRRSIFGKDKIVSVQEESIKVHDKEIDHDRIPKNIRTEKKNRRLVVCGVGAGTLFWILLFISMYFFFERQFLQKEKRVYNNLTLNLARTCYLNFLNAYISEEIAYVNTTAIYDYPGHSEIVNQRLRFRDLLEEANARVLDPDILDLPSAFSKFLKQYKIIMVDNICPYYSSNVSEQADCEQFANGLLKSGLRMIVMTDALLGDSVIQDYQASLSQIDTSNATQVNSTITNTILSSDYLKIARTPKYLTPVLQTLRGLIIEAIDEFFSYNKFMGAVLFIVILALALLMYAVLWYQSSKGLGNRIIKSKRMLTMIPMEFVLNNEIFKERVLSQDIHQVLA